MWEKLLEHLTVEQLETLRFQLTKLWSASFNELKQHPMEPTKCTGALYYLSRAIDSIDASL